MPDFSRIVELIKEHCSDVLLDEKSSPKAIIVPPADVLKVCKALHEHLETYFDMLSCLTGIDNGPQVNTMEVVYNFYSIPFNIHLMVKTILPRENPVVDSVTSVWRTADWHEREAFDMYGITFTGHPDLRRILMPADWEGYPLRKDYVHQEYYRDIKVKY